MRIEVRRITETSKSIIGEMWVDGQKECLTLEPSRDHPYHEGHPCVPTGDYRVELTFSPHFQIVTPEVMNVPGRSDIRIHIGNFPKNTLGCTLVGVTKGTDSVFSSEIAFNKLMTLLRTTDDEIRIMYIDPE